MFGQASANVGAICLAATAALAVMLAAPCTAQEVTESRSIQNSEQIREVTALTWWQSSVSAVGVAVGLTQLTRQRAGFERQQVLEADSPQPTIGLRYRLSDRSSLALDTVYDRSQREVNAAPLFEGFAKKAPSFAANIRSGLRFQMDSGFQMQVKVRRSGVNFMVRKDFY